MKKLAGKKPRGKKRRRQGITEPGGETERNRTRENFGPSTSSTSFFYHHCLRLERRRSDRELEKGTNRRRGSNTGNTTRGKNRDNTEKTIKNRGGHERAEPRGKTQNTQKRKKKGRNRRHRRRQGKKNEQQ